MYRVDGLPLDARIYVAGHSGLVGSALLRALDSRGYCNLVTRTHAALDLTDQAAVRGFFSSERPEYVFLAAARVGGVAANESYPADFISANLAIQSNVIDEAVKNKVRRLLFLGSSCIYPQGCPQPIKEEYLLTGPLEPTNRSYALAKIAGIEMCSAYNRQHGTRYVAVMPANLYGPRDNYDLQTSHVLPALIRKIHEAKVEGRAEVVIWGSGKPRREFLYSDDLADACVFLMNLSETHLLPVLDARATAPLINIGTGKDLTIIELATLIGEIIGYDGGFVFDPARPHGTFQKVLDVSRVNALGWQAKTSLREGIRRTYNDFLEAG